MSRAACPSTSKPVISSGTASKPRPTVIERESISSRVAASESKRSGSARVAASMLLNTAMLVVFSFGTGMVRRTASAMNARVPSEPTRRCSKILTCESKSRNALRA